jgi:hypothetical protein
MEVEMQSFQHFAIIFWLSLLAALFAWQFAGGQPGVELYNTLHAFGGTAATYNATMDSAGNGYFGVKSSATADTIYSWVYTSKNLKGGVSLYIHAQRDTLATASTDTSKLQMGLWRGDSYGSDGWEWKNLAEWGLTNANNDKSIILADSTWFTKNVTSKWKFRVIETAADTNIYYLDQFFLKTVK